jgi:serine/threonine protein kinase
MSHVLPEELQLILDGRATSDGLDEAVQHLATCEACQNMARAEAQTLDIVLGAAQPGSTVGTGFAAGARLGAYNLIGPLEENETEGPFLAVDPRDGQKVVIRLERSSFEGVIALLTHRRFWRDVRAVTALRHPNVLALHQAGIYKDRVFVACELVTGQRLLRWLAAQPRGWREVLTAFLEAGAALDAAHAAGLTHGDFGLQSVLVTATGVKVDGFGLGPLPRAQGRSDDGFDALLEAPEGASTSAFLSPEQRRDGEPDLASDQFSFCAALYVALTGHHPFGATVEHAMPACTAHEVRSSIEAKVPRWLHATLVQGLSPDPAKRWPSMRALLERLAHPPLLGLSWLKA